MTLLLLAVGVLIFSYFMYLGLSDSSMYYEGRDTRKVFGDGSLQIGHSPGADVLNDLEKHKVIEKEIYSYEQKGEILYCYGRVGFTVINIKDKTIRQFKVISLEDTTWHLSMQDKYGDKYTNINAFDEFSEEEQSVFKELQVAFTKK